MKKKYKYCKIRYSYFYNFKKLLSLQHLWVVVKLGKLPFSYKHNDITLEKESFFQKPDKKDWKRTRESKLHHEPQGGHLAPRQLHFRFIDVVTTI